VKWSDRTESPNPYECFSLVKLLKAKLVLYSSPEGVEVADFRRHIT
jgi:hypothetical protein